MSFNPAELPKTAFYEAADVEPPLKEKVLREIPGRYLRE
jgi:hypothetical protein